jgi:protein ImuB
MVAVVLSTGVEAAASLTAVARAFSPRIDVHGPREVSLDVAGLGRLFGDARSIGAELRRSAADSGLQVRVALASTRTAARLLVRHRAGVTVVEPGSEAAVVGALPVEMLEAIDVASSDAAGAADEAVRTFRRWGLRTLGEIAALPADAVLTRMGADGLRWHRLSRGEDLQPFVPAVPEERFEQALDLEWPIEGLEPLSFVLGRLMDPLSAHLERRGRGAAVLRVSLHLVTRAVHERTVQLPAPMHDARTLRTLALLDLESHPPEAAIDRVVVSVDPTPARVVQHSLLTRPLPTPEQLSTLMARLGALMGEGRCGRPVAVDSWKPGACAMAPFAPSEDETAQVHDDASASGAPRLALRRFRVPMPARVRLEDGVPCRVIGDRRGWAGGPVLRQAGPWRTSGQWWCDAASDRWDRDEWDVTLGDGATYRLFQARDTGQWFIDGLVD